MIKTSFLRLDRDHRPHLQPQGGYPYALNAKRDMQSGGLTNELYRVARTKVPGKTVGYHRVEERNSTLFFHTDGASVISLWNHDTHELKEVCRDSDFGACTWAFNECKWMGHGHSVSKTLAPCNDLLIYFSSAMYYYVVNIDEVMDEQRKKSILQLDDPCEYFRLFKTESNARMRMRTNRGGGQDLPPGQYYGTYRLLDDSNNKSNWAAIEGPVYIGSKYNKYTDTSRQSIQFEVKSLPKNYSRIEIAVIPPIGSQTQDIAYVIYDGSYNTNGVSCQYYSANQHKKIIAIKDILDKDNKWIRGCSMFQADGKLRLLQTVQEFNPKVQKFWQKTELSFIAFAVPSSSAHKYKSLERDEVYGFGVEGKYITQEYTAAGHIAGPPGGANEILCDKCPTLPPGNTGNNSSLLETYTSFTSTGEKLCLIGGQLTTQNEGYTPIQACEEQGLENRSSEDGNDCVEHETDSTASQSAIDNLQNTPDTISDCIDCDEAANKNDLQQGSNFFTRFLEHTTDLFRTDKDVASDCTTGKSTTIYGAAKELYNKAVKGAEKNEEIKYRTVIKKQTKGENLKRTNSGVSVQYFGTTGEDCLTDEIEPVVLAKFKPGGYESTYTYPKTLDCDGQPLYGDLQGLPIRHFKTPGYDLVPLTITAQSGVDSRFDPSNVPGKDTYVIMLGIQVDNVYIPSYDMGEIPKPLDQNEPFRIVMADRARHNSSNLFHAYVTPTFKGKQGNKEYAVPRHGTCSYANVDRSIDNDGSHLGEDWDIPIYNAHSPDIHNASEFINADYVQVEGRLEGTGMVYGLYAKGKEVKEEDNRKDRRGARGALNLSTFFPDKFTTCIKGSEFAEFNTNLQNPEGMDYPVLNKYRESSVAFQTAEQLPTIGTNNKDWSFNVGGLDHEYLTSGYAWYVTFKRFNTAQYGNIESLQYNDIGLTGRKGQTSARALTGDSFVQKWSHKRTSYVSDKVGNALNVDYPETADPDFLGPAGDDGMDRSVCDYPNRVGMRMKEWLGFFFPQELPENGDKKDPKNMANGHPTLFASQIQGIKTAADTDLYFPRTYAHLNHLFVETRTNLYYRSTAMPATREVFYENLQGLDVDSSINKTDPEDAWLNDWHNEQLQPSKKQKEKKAKIRFLIGIIFPLILMGGAAGIETSLELGTTALFGGGGMLIMYLILVRNILSGKKLDKLLGLPECKTDDEGAQDENNTRGLKDNWNDYNWGFSDMNDLNLFIGMPSPYITCVCDALSNVVFSSNQQIHTSPYDAYKNFQALAYTGIPAEAGKLQLMFQWQNGIYAQTTDGIFMLQQGENGWVPYPRKVGEGIFEGFGGTEDPNAGIICQAGYVSVDYEAKTFSIFSGNYKIITDRKSGMNTYFKDEGNFNFCSEGSCRDQMNSSGTHFTFGYDPEHQLLLITKKDGTGGHTFSYDVGTGDYVSEHSYVPDFYFWDRHKLYSVQDGEIFEHNVEGKYLTPFIVDAYVHNKEGEYFNYSHTEIDTEVNKINRGVKPDLFDREETFDYITTRTAFLQTGRLEVIKEDRDDARSTIQNIKPIKVERQPSGMFELNHIRSWEGDRDDNIIEHQPCGDIEKFNSANLSDTDTVQKTKRFRGRYLHHRFEFERDDRQIIFYGLTTYLKDADTQGVKQPS